MRLLTVPLASTAAANDELARLAMRGQLLPGANSRLRHQRGRGFYPLKKEGGLNCTPYVGHRSNLWGSVQRPLPLAE